MRTITRILAIACCAGLLACGGGSESGNSASGGGTPGGSNNNSDGGSHQPPLPVPSCAAILTFHGVVDTIDLPFDQAFSLTTTATAVIFQPVSSGCPEAASLGTTSGYALQMEYDGQQVLKTVVDLPPIDGTAFDLAVSSAEPDLLLAGAQGVTYYDGPSTDPDCTMTLSLPVGNGLGATVARVDEDAHLSLSVRVDLTSATGNVLDCVDWL